MTTANLTATNSSATLTDGWKANPDGRGTLNIIWSCAVTVFLCCWTSVCVNIPARTDGWFEQYRDKFNLALLGLLGPEFLFLLAIGQQDQARRSVMRFREAGFNDWTMTHAFFVNMGGHVIEIPGSEAFPVNSDQLLYLIAHGYIECPTTEKADIDDRNKSDTLARYEYVLGPPHVLLLLATLKSHTSLIERLRYLKSSGSPLARSHALLKAYS